jgi:GMP synthase-like glutamine amidotransferase
MLHIIQNDPEVPPGSLTDHLPLPHRLHHPYRDGLLSQMEDISALIVLGGAMGANDDYKHPFLADLKLLIRQVVAEGIPYLGVCLGGQLLAAALGAKVVSNRWEEIGSFTATLTDEGKRDPLFQGITADFLTFQWHHDSFDIPAGGVVLASSVVCPHQAFRVGESAWGVQFHPEVTGDIIRCWAAWDTATSGRVEALVAEFQAEAENYAATVRQLMRNFLSAAKLLPVA